MFFSFETSAPGSAEIMLDLIVTFVGVFVWFSVVAPRLCATGWYPHGS